MEKRAKTQGPASALRAVDCPGAANGAKDGQGSCVPYTSGTHKVNTESRARRGCVLEFALHLSYLA